MIDHIFSTCFDALTGKQPSLSIAILEIFLISLVSRMWQNEKKRRKAIEQYLKMLAVRIRTKGKVTADLLAQCKLDAAQADGVNPDIYPIREKAYCKMCVLCSTDPSYDLPGKKKMAEVLMSAKNDIIAHDRKIVVRRSRREIIIQIWYAFKEILKATPWVTGVYLLACVVQACIDGQQLDFAMMVLLLMGVSVLSFIGVLAYSVLDWIIKTC